MHKPPMRPDGRQATSRQRKASRGLKLGQLNAFDRLSERQQKFRDSFITMIDVAEAAYLAGFDLDGLEPPRPLAPSDPLACRERRELHQTNLQQARLEQALVDDVFASVEPSALAKGLRQAPWRPGLIDQAIAVQEAHLHGKLERRIRRHHRRRTLERGRPFTVLAVTLAGPDWILPTLNPQLLATMRAQIQRQAKRLPGDWTATGMIDVCPLYDQLSGVKGWSFHAHLTVQIDAQYIAAKRAVRKAFPYRADGARGVPRPIVIRKAYDPCGWSRYQEKSLVARGIRQRTVKVDHNGKRLDAQKSPLTEAQRREWVAFLAKVKGSDFMIWVGHRRYGTRLVAMPCKR